MPGVKTIKSFPSSFLIVFSSLAEATTPSSPASLAFFASCTTKSSTLFLLDSSLFKVSWLMLVKTVTAKTKGFFLLYFWAASKAPFFAGMA